LISFFLFSNKKNKNMLLISLRRTVGTLPLRLKQGKHSFGSAKQWYQACMFPCHVSKVQGIHLFVGHHFKPLDGRNER
jgi:hypothetical protein